MPKTVITILALGYSGSHYLSLLLGSHSRTMHIGEIHHAGKTDAKKPRILCSICQGRTQCPVLHDIGPQNIHNAYAMIFSRVDPSVSALIDTSKNPRWAARFIGTTDFQMKYIHLIRDPRALIRRWTLTYTMPRQQWHVRWKVMRALPRLAPRLLFGSQHDIYLYHWLLSNQALSRFIRQHRLDARVVTYRDLATAPDGELKPLMDWIGLEYEPTQLEYWNVEHHGTQKVEYEWVKREKTRFIDLRWQTDLPQETIQRVVENPMINS
jgi:hypothetical protein